MRRPSHAILPFTFAASAALLFGCAPPEDSEHIGEAASALGQPLGAETEPNGAAAMATPITKDGVVRANITPNADEDYYSFTAVAGERVYAATMTAFSSGGVDSTLDLIGPDGQTVIETDDNDGSLGPNASSIAGPLLAQSGTHYLRVRHAMASNIRPYDLHIKTRSGAPVSETEPNNLPNSPQMLPPSGWVSGSISSGTDVDIFSISLNAGDTVFASLDVDPERDGTEFSGVLGMGPFAGGYLQVNDGLQIGPDSEALFATVKASGTYSISVSSAGGTSGTYQLSVSVHPAAALPNCTTYSSVGGAIAIPTGPGQITSTINVPGSPRIADIDVSLNLNHANPPDLDITLQSPKGSQVGLFTDIGSSMYQSLDVTIDDEAAFPISSSNMLTALTVAPEPNHRLDWFDGENAGGAWTLRVADDAALNAGSLNSWSLTICEPPATLPCSSGLPTPLLSTDFESGAAGFAHSGSMDSWARGLPAQVPYFADCNSGSGCFKTNLNGNYPNSSSQDLISPPMNLTGFKSPIRVTWAMKYQMESASYDHAYVLVREVGGANPQHLFDWTGPTMTVDVGNPITTVQEVAGWGLYTADIAAYAGKTVELVFHLDSDATTTFAGLAVDDVSVSACPAQVCGNNQVEGTEKCDDGNLTNGDGCDSNCTPTGCGNGVQTMGEKCDDGNLTNGDGCDSNCTPTGCGNTIVTMGEQCDDGNLLNGDGCDNNCTVTACGNAIVTMGEVCDDGNLIDGDGCDSNCTPTGCGNTIVTMGEVCDDGNLTDGDGCDSNCTVTACGNTIVTMGEVCDDGNLTDGDGCDSNCTLTACGNGIVTMGELCDEGNMINGDGCDDGLGGNCTPSACGNGVVAGGEGCDDGNLTDGDGCDANCTMTGCGNGVKTMNEACDDGNAVSGDGCDNNCTPTGCGNGVQTMGEECDDGNLADGDGCSATCTVVVCGNGKKDPGEACDDGNKTNGDGCDDNCTPSGCGNGVKDPSEGCDDGDKVEGNGCDSNCTPSGCGNGVKDPREGCDDGNTKAGDGCSPTCGLEGSSGAGGTGGAGTGGEGGAGAMNGGAAGAGAGTGGRVPQPEGGCSCDVPGGDRSSPWAQALALVGLGLLARRRRAA